MVSNIPCGGDRMTAALMSTYESVHITTKSRGYLRRLCDFFSSVSFAIRTIDEHFEDTKGVIRSRKSKSE